MSVSFSPLSNFGYLGLSAQTDDNPVKPSTFIRIMSEGLKPKYNVQPLQEVSGSRERLIRNIQDKIEMDGPIEFNVEDKGIYHFLRSFHGNATKQTVATGVYRYVLQITNTTKPYTIDVRPGDAPWVHRFWGAQVVKLNYSRNGNAIKGQVQIMPTKAFTVAAVTTDASSGVTLLVDQTSGLTTSDTLVVIDKSNGSTVKGELGITSVDSENQLTVSTIGFSIVAGDLIGIKAAAVTDASYNQNPPFQFMNGTAVYTGADIDNTVEEEKEDLELETMNDVDPRWTSGPNQINRYPAEILIKGYEASGKITKWYDGQSKISKLRNNEHIALRVVMNGPAAITTNSATKARSNFGGVNGFYVEAATAGKAGNDLNITIVMNSTDSLAASKSGNNILLKLANTTMSNNTGTLIAAALDALTGVDAGANGTGAQQFTSADVLSNTNLGFHSSGTNVVGSDANTKPYLQYDFASAALDPFFPNLKENEIIPQDVPLKFYVDSNGSNIQRKNWSCRVFLVTGESY